MSTTEEGSDEEQEMEETEVERPKVERQNPPSTAYQMFIGKQWLEFKANRKENEKYSATELSKEFGKKWKELSEEERQRYSELADKHNEERRLNRSP